MISKCASQYLRQRALSNAAALTYASQRNFAGGGAKKPPMPASETDFDVVLVGGINATAITKFLQADGVNYKMALVTDKSRFILPEVYFGASHGHLAELKLESGTISAQVDQWSRSEVQVRVKEFKPQENKVVLTNGKEFSYKALVVATGFDHSSSHIEGLPDFECDRGENNVFVHEIDKKERMHRNYYHGWNHPNGDMLCYSPKLPYKGEGTDFYALYYEHYMRQDKWHGRAVRSAKIQFWTPNKVIYEFPYANEVALEECKKRNIDVMFGWELVQMKKNEVGQTIGVFKNVDSGEVMEKDFMTAVINPTSKPQKELVSSGIAGSNGMVDVNPYTLQHKRFENIFAFGDCIDGRTTRTQTAAIAQCPVVKHNLKNFMEGKELNAIYNGYTFLPFFLGHSYATSFSHLYDFEPHFKNHIIPHYGVFSRVYFGRMLKSSLSSNEKYGGFKKNHGPPYYQFNPRYVPLEHNEYLQQKGVAPQQVKLFEPKVRVEAAHH